jgi:hypothetical protein
MDGTLHMNRYQWSTCFSRAHAHFKAAEQAMLLKRPEECLVELTKSMQWLQESVPIIVKEK